MNPAKMVIDKLGGHRAVADILEKNVSSVYRWTYPKSNGGTDGLIPIDDAQKLLEHCREAGKDLCPEDFFVLGVDGSNAA